MSPLWRQIAFAETAYCQRFVDIMHFMDPRYRAFEVEQIQQWLQGVAGPYVGDTMAAFAWFPRVEDMASPGRMQIVLLARYKAGSARAELLMLGWAPASPATEPAALDTVIDDILEKAEEWLGTLPSATPIKSVSAIRPFTMGWRQVQCLHDRIYARAAAYSPLVPGRFLQLIHERQRGDAAYWEIQVVS